MSCIKSLPEVCRLGIARVGIRTLLLVLFTCVMQHTAVLLGNSSTLNKRGENPPRCNRTTPADFSLANSTVYAQTIFSFSAVMAFHEALKISYPFIKHIPIAASHSYRCARICRTEQRDATLSFRPRFAVQHGARISGYEMPGGSRYGQDRQ